MPNVKIYIGCKGGHCYYCQYQGKSEIKFDERGGAKPYCILFKVTLERSKDRILEEGAWNKYQHRKFDVLRCSACHSAELHDQNDYKQHKNMID